MQVTRCTNYTALLLADVMCAADVTSTDLHAPEQHVDDADVASRHCHEAVHEQLAIIAQACRDLRSDVTADGIDCRPCSLAACTATEVSAFTHVKHKGTGRAHCTVPVHGGDGRYMIKSGSAVTAAPRLARACSVPDDQRHDAPSSGAPVISFTRLTTSSEEVSMSSSAPIALSSSKYALFRTCQPDGESARHIPDLSVRDG